MGRIFDDRGHRMTPSHVRKRGIKYRYYISSALLQGQAEQAGAVSRVPAGEIEALVVKCCSRSSRPIDRQRRCSPHPQSRRPRRGPIGPVDHRTRPTQKVPAKTEAKPQRIEVPWHKIPSTRRREILVPDADRLNKSARSVPRTAHFWSHRLRGGAVGSTSS